MSKDLRGLTFDTTVCMSIPEADTEAEFRLTVDYNYFAALPAFTPRGEYAPIDPPEPAHVEIVSVRLWDSGDSHIPCPGFLADMVSDDPGIYAALIDDAEGDHRRSIEYDHDDDGQPDEMTEWRDYDPDC